MMPFNRCQPANGQHQRGQSSVFVIVFLGITLLSLVFLYKAGKLTSEKMELQNAADGVAYSVAILEARDLNFMAYTNRAMVANEVAIGQAVGLASWSRHWESIGYYENRFCGTALEPIADGLDKGGQALEKAGQAVSKIPVPPGVFQVIGTIMEKVGSIFIKIGEELNKQCEKIRAGTKADFIDRGKALATEVDRDIVIPLVQLMEKANQGLRDAQAIFHLGTMAYVTKTVAQVTEHNMTDNTPGDTMLSPYGLAALLGHLMSFGHLAPYIGSYGPDPNRQNNPYIRTYKPSSGSGVDKTGFERFAAITGAARDEFGKGPRRWVANPNFNDDIDVSSPDLPLGACPGTVATLCFGWLRFAITFRKGLTTPIDHRAGSELRHVNNPIFGAGRGDQYNWSSGDTSSGGLDYTFSAGVRLEYAPPSSSGPSYTRTLAGANGIVRVGTTGFSFGLSFTITIPIINQTFTFPIGPFNFGGGVFPGMSFGAGAAQAHNNNTNKIGTLDSLLLLTPLPLAQVVGLPGSDYYGHAPGGSSVSGISPLIPIVGNKFAHASAFAGGSGALSLPYAHGGPDFPDCPKGTLATAIPNLLLNCKVPTVDTWMPNQAIKNGLYTGLKQYSDTIAVDDLWGFEGPHIIIALQKQITDIFSPTAPLSATTPQPNRFILTESSNTNDVIGAIAKGEVYFKRPSDMDMFRRWDTPKSSSGKGNTLYEEYGSAFNPYWQARLAPLSHADRAVATVQQHNQDLEGGSANQTITDSWDLETWID